MENSPEQTFSESLPAREAAQRQAQPDGIAKIILKAVDDAVMRVGGSANCYNEPADANSGAEYVAARVRSVIVSSYSRCAQSLPAGAETVGEHGGLITKIARLADIGSAEEFRDALERLKTIRGLIDDKENENART